MKLKLCIIGFFFCLIATIGLVTISDTEIPIPLPIDGAFSIQGVYHEKKSKNAWPHCNDCRSSLY